MDDMKWHVGQVVKNRPEFAKVYEGADWADKMKRLRTGVIVELPLAIRTHPEQRGTMLVHWQSLTGSNADLRLWQRWIHSDFVEPA